MDTITFLLLISRKQTIRKPTVDTQKIVFPPHKTQTTVEKC